MGLGQKWTQQTHGSRGAVPSLDGAWNPRKAILRGLALHEICWRRKMHRAERTSTYLTERTPTSWLVNHRACSAASSSAARHLGNRDGLFCMWESVLCSLCLRHPRKGLPESVRGCWSVGPRHLDRLESSEGAAGRGDPRVVG